MGVSKLGGVVFPTLESTNTAGKSSGAKTVDPKNDSIMGAVGTPNPPNAERSGTNSGRSIPSGSAQLLQPHPPIERSGAKSGRPTLNTSKTELLAAKLGLPPVNLADSKTRKPGGYLGSELAEMAYTKMLEVQSKVAKAESLSQTARADDLARGNRKNKGNTLEEISNELAKQMELLRNEQSVPQKQKSPRVVLVENGKEVIQGSSRVPSPPGQPSTVSNTTSSTAADGLLPLIKNII